MERVVIDLARHGRRAGNDDRILLFDRDRVDPDRDLDPEDVPVVCEPRRRGLDPGCVLRIARRIRALRPVVVHAHNDTALVYVDLARRLVPRRARPAVLVTFHNLPPHATALARRAARHALRRAHAVTAVAEQLADELRARRWIGRATVATVIQNGVDLGRFTPVVHRPSPALRIGFVARLARPKRHDLLLEAAGALESEGHSLALTIAGDGPNSATIRSAVAGLREARWLGHVPDVAALHHELDAAVLLSDHEGEPLAMLEAMASGLPVVASAAGGIPAIGGEGEGILLVRNESRAVATALRRLLDVEVRTSLGARARSRVSESRSLERTAARYAALHSPAT